MTEERIPLFDAHCDTACAMYRGNWTQGLRENRYHVDLVRGASYAPRAQIFAIFAHGDDLYHQYLCTRDGLLRELSENDDLIRLCRTGQDAKPAFDQGRQAAFLSVEGAELLDCSLQHLEEDVALGVRCVNITWNNPNPLSGTNLHETDRGLSPAGRAFVRRCGELGVLVDVSHISDPGFWDVLECACGPVVATHSNARALCPHPRNLTDEMFRGLAEYGGVAGLNFYPVFLGDHADVDTLTRHAEHFLALGGEKHLGIGGDLDGIDAMPRGMRGIEDVKVLYYHLQELGWSQRLLHNVFFQNFMDVFSKEDPQ